MTARRRLVARELVGVHRYRRRTDGKVREVRVTLRRYSDGSTIKVETATPYL